MNVPGDFEPVRLGSWRYVYRTCGRCRAWVWIDEMALHCPPCVEAT